MMQDIQRISMEPTAEDRDWFPDIAGNGDWRETLLDAWANHRDELFIRQYLSPALMRKWRLFVLADEAKESHFEVASIHNERGYEKIRADACRQLRYRRDPAGHPGGGCGSPGRPAFAP